MWRGEYNSPVAQGSAVSLERCGDVCCCHPERQPQHTASGGPAGTRRVLGTASSETNEACTHCHGNNACREIRHTSGCGQPRNIRLNSPVHMAGHMPTWCHEAVHIHVHKCADSRTHAGTRRLTSLCVLVCRRIHSYVKTGVQAHTHYKYSPLPSASARSQVKFLSGVSTL